MFFFYENVILSLGYNKASNKSDVYCKNKESIKLISDNDSLQAVIYTYPDHRCDELEFNKKE
ncbi:hypothetical protein [Conservatibacter flavescens]|uniref:Uncharacterized protein n=1 Tax=Conservatibacter flavescens TaxID=28161 RepID=A0A2M8RZY1_9PAST|nr:hypothetical protein [Conservatibacter flavescens]PJG84461.1 hypothetical protein CVP05_11200 [Conservatibacter flavescens]